MKNMKTLAIGLGLLAMSLTAAAQRDWGCTPEKQQEMMEPVSLYQDAMKQYKASKDGRYLEETYPRWQTIVANCPKQSKNLYLNGATILKYLINNAKTAASRDSLISELMAMYDTRIENYGERAEVLARKAMDYEALKPSDVKGYYDIYAAAVEAGGTDLEAAYAVKYLEATIKYVKAGLAEPTLVVDNYDAVSEVLEAQLIANAADSAKAALIRGYIGGVEAAFSPYADCGQLVEIYAKKFEADPENIDLLKKISGILMKKGCTNEPLFFATTEKLYSLEPSPSIAVRMGKMCIQKQKYSEAAKYLNDAVKDLTETKDRYNAYLLLGIAYGATNSYSAARSAFNRAAEIDPTKGEPYRQIAQLYAQSSATASEDNIHGRSAYWAAVDKANKAKQVDPSPENVEAADAQIARYRAYFPAQADAFMAGLENGQRFTVPGWIGESTIVRTK